MTKLIAMLSVAFSLVPMASGTTYSFTPYTSNDTILADLALGSSGGNTYNFAAGTYTQATGVWKFYCIGGNVFKGPYVPFVVGTGVAPTAIFAPTYNAEPYHAVEISGTSGYTYPGAGCKVQDIATTNLNWEVDAGTSGLLFQLNNPMGLSGAASHAFADAGIYMDGGASSNDQNYNSIQLNTFGPSCTDIDDDSNDYSGACGGIAIYGSNVGVSISNNNVSGQIEELLHTLAGSTSGDPGVQVSTNLVVENNDCGHVHRICIELQQEDVTGLIVSYNDYHDPYNPYAGSVGISNACCSSLGGSASGNPTTTYNVVISNTPSCSADYGWCMGYGIEAWGNEGIWQNNLIQANNASSFGIALGGYADGSTTAGNITNNVIQGPDYLNSFINCEQGGTFPDACTFVSGSPTVLPNTTSTTITAQTSTPPTISPSSGGYSGVQVITVANAGINTSSYCTTDGSSPVPGAGTAFLYTAPFDITPPTTVNCVGMWGTGANPYSYPTGYGYVPSSPVTAQYTSPSGGGPTFVNALITTSPANGTSVGVGGYIQFEVTCYYSDGSSDNCNTADSHGVGVSSWHTSDSSVMTIGAVGSSHPGRGAGVSAGIVSASAVLGSTGSAQPYQITVN